MRKNVALWILLGVVLLSFLFRQGCYYFSYAMDTYSRPWAYSKDPNKPLLVGHWAGDYVDPDGKKHHLEIEIVPPTTEAERWDKVNRRRKRKGRRSTTSFDGTAVIVQGNTRDTLELWGGLEKARGTALHFNIRPLDDHYPIGFQLQEAKGEWLGNRLKLSGSFTYHKADGSGYWSSEDPKFEKIVSFEMTRQ